MDWARSYPTEDSSAPSALPIHSSLHVTLALYKLFLVTYLRGATVKSSIGAPEVVRHDSRHQTNKNLFLN